MNADPFWGESTRPTSMSRSSSKEGYIQGYKDLPSLASIREKVGTGLPIIEVEKESVMQLDITNEEGSVGMKNEHPLQHVWYATAKSLIECRISADQGWW